MSGVGTNVFDSAVFGTAPFGAPMGGRATGNTTFPGFSSVPGGGPYVGGSKNPFASPNIPMVHGGSDSQVEPQVTYSVAAAISSQYPEKIPSPGEPCFSVRNTNVKGVIIKVYTLRDLNTFLDNNWKELINHIRNPGVRMGNGSPFNINDICTENNFHDLINYIGLGSNLLDSGAKTPNASISNGDRYKIFQMCISGKTSTAHIWAGQVRSTDSLGLVVKRMNNDAYKAAIKDFQGLPANEWRGHIAELLELIGPLQVLPITSPKPHFELKYTFSNDLEFKTFGYTKEVKTAQAFKYLDDDHTIPANLRGTLYASFDLPSLKKILDDKSNNLINIRNVDLTPKIREGVVISVGTVVELNATNPPIETVVRAITKTPRNDYPQRGSAIENENLNLYHSELYTNFELRICMKNSIPKFSSSRNDGTQNHAAFDY